MKSYTDIEQSKKLAEILPLESADMVLLHEEPYETSDSKFDGLHQALCVPFNKYDKSWRQKYKNISYFPCWSLAALLNILAKIANKIDDDGSVDLSSFMGQWSVNMFDCPVEATNNYDNPIDACVAMIEKLHELKIL